MKLGKWADGKGEKVVDMPGGKQCKRVGFRTFNVWHELYSMG